MLYTRALPHFLMVECFIGRNHLPGAWVSVTLEMARRNSFNLIFGPADSAGLLRLSRAQLLDQAQQNREVFPYDFGNPTNDWTGRIRIEALNLSDVAKALQAHRSLKNLVKYPDDFETRMSDLATRLKQSRGELLSVKAAAVPGDSVTLESAKMKAVS